MNSCLVLLDMQKGILQSDRIPWQSPEIPTQAISAARLLVDAARRLKVPVLHVGVVRAHAKGSSDEPRTQAAARSGKVPRDILPMSSGSKDVEFVIAPSADEEVIHKGGVSAFAGTRLEQFLRNLNVRDVFIAGAFTHMVVESTARAGFDLGFCMHVVGDACCSPSKALHDASLSTGISNFAFVLENNKEAIAAWETGASAT